MCGIGGILRTDGQPIPEEWLDAIDARIAYRGPDGAGRFRDRVEWMDDEGNARVVDVAFVHRRLSIIDHADGAQPMVSERGRDDSEGLVAVVFNGCIYNHRELRAELESRGHVFVTDHSDTEVLIHGWREWGEELPEHLEGMYAFAVWERAKRQLILMRDWCGRKPLFVHCLPETVNPSDEECAVVLFSSDSHALASAHRPEINPRGGASWTRDLLLRGYCEMHVHPAADIRTVGCGHWMRYPWPGRNWGNERGNWMIQAEKRSRSGEIESLLERAVARRLEADVPLGCFLSGGVDSSLIAHFAKQHKPDLMTFTVRMPDARYDESAHAEAVAKHLGTDHHTLDVAMNPAEDLVHLIHTLGQPFGDSSILPTYWVSKAARQHVKVALAGDGGDELFLGYERYLAAPILAKHHKLLAKVPSAVLRKAHPKSKIAKFARLGDMARDYPHIGIAAMEAIFTQDQIAKLLQPEQRPSESGFAQPDAEPQEALPHGRGSDQKHKAIRELRDFDLDHYLPDDLLRKTDTASMAVALEVRCPFLDRDLAAAVLAMPIEQLIPNGERKGLLRSIARQYLPAGVVDRPKMGFAIPIGEWFRSDFGGMKTLLLDHLNSAEPFGPIELNRTAVRRLVDQHMAGRADHAHRLFTLLTLSIWARQADDRAGGGLGGSDSETLSVEPA